MKVRRILSLENGQVGLTQSETQLLANANVIASDSGEEEFYGFD